MKPITATFCKATGNGPWHITRGQGPLCGVRRMGIGGHYLTVPARQVCQKCRALDVSIDSS